MDDSDFYSYILKNIFKYIVIIGSIIALGYFALQGALVVLSWAVFKLMPPTPKICTPNAENLASNEIIRITQNLELIGHFGGTIQSAFATDSYLYVGIGPEFAVLDINNLAMPQRVGYTVLQDKVTDILIEGTYAYVATADSGLRIVDVSNPLFPIETGAYVTPAPIIEVSVSNGYAYLLLSKCNQMEFFSDKCAGAIQIIDISNSSNPVQISCYQISGLPVSMTISENYAYMSITSKSGDKNLVTLDISDPTRVTEFKSIDTEFDGKLTVTNNYIYVSNSSWFEVFDISNRDNPTKVTTLNSSDIIESQNNSYVFGEVNKYVYINGGIKILDISNPVQPLLISSYNFDGEIEDFSFNKDHIFIVSEDVIHVVDTTNLSLLEKTGEYQSNKSTYNLEVSDNLLYATSSGNGFQVINISNPKFPFVSGAFSSEKPAISGMTITEDIAYLAIKDLGIQVIDISNPNVPVELGFHPTVNGINDIAMGTNGVYITTTNNDFEILKFQSGTFNKTRSFNMPYDFIDAAIEGNIAYILGDNNVLWTVDISTPEVFKIIDFYQMSIDAHTLETDGKYLYFTTDNGIQIIQLTDKGLPIQEPLSILEDLSFKSILVEENFIYAIGGNNMWVINISNLAQPELEGSYTAKNDVLQLIKDKKYTYLYIEENGILVLDTEIPSSIVEVGTFISPPPYGDMAIIDHCLYLTAGRKGLKVIDIEKPSNPIDINLSFGDIESGITKAGNYIYISNQRSFMVLDVTNPCHPSVVKQYVIPESSYPDPEAGWGKIIEASDNYAFMSDYTDEQFLWILDISQPSNPKKIKSYYKMWSIAGVETQGTYAYILQYDGFRVIDITNPILPTELGHYIEGYTLIEVKNSFFSTSTWSFIEKRIDMQDITLSDKLAFIANSDEDTTEDVLVFDISNPNNPVKINYYTLPSQIIASGVAKDDNGYLYVATGKDGVFIYKIKE